MICCLLFVGKTFCLGIELAFLGNAQEAWTWYLVSSTILQFLYYEAKQNDEVLISEYDVEHHNILVFKVL
jgi:hypothetical protein